MVPMESQWSVNDTKRETMECQWYQKRDNGESMVRVKSRWKVNGTYEESKGVVPVLKTIRVSLSTRHVLSVVLELISITPHTCTTTKTLRVVPPRRTLGSPATVRFRHE